MHSHVSVYRQGGLVTAFRQFTALLFLSMVTASTWSGCPNPNSQEPDSGLDAEFDGTQDGSDQAPDEDQGPRTLVGGTDGFCLTRVEVDDSCTTVDDCMGYRGPVLIGCCSNVQIRNPSGCSFANGAEFPVVDECTADEACRRAPRACVAGRCVEDLPDRACQQNSDCRLIDTGCDCIAASVLDDDYAPVYGQDCAGMTACPADAGAICVEKYNPLGDDPEGYCLIAGPFMEPAIEAFCACLEDIEPDLDQESCEESFRNDFYYNAAASWAMIKNIDLVDSCLAFIFGPLSNFMECLTILCP